MTGSVSIERYIFILSSGGKFYIFFSGHRFQHVFYAPNFFVHLADLLDRIFRLFKRRKGAEVQLAFYAPIAPAFCSVEPRI